MHRAAYATCAFVAIVSVVHPARAQQIGRTYENKEEGFSLRMPDQFEPIPPKKAEAPWELVEFKGPMLIEYAKAGAVRYESNGTAVRFTSLRTGSDRAPSESNAKPDRGELLRQVGPKTVKEWLEKNPFRRAAKMTKEKDFALGALKGKIYEYTIEGDYGSGYQGSAVSLPSPDGEFGIAYEIMKKDFDKWSPVFMTSFKSIKFFPRESGSSGSAASADASPRDKRLAEVQEKIKGMKGWYCFATDHYVILSDTDRELVKEVSRHLESIRKLYEKMFPPTKPIEAVSVVRICKNENDYYNNGGPGGSAGVWMAGQEELLIYDDTAHNKAHTFATMYHEAFHQYIYYSCGELSPHDWYNEGTGDYFAGAKLKGDKFEIGKMDWRTETIRNAVRTGDYIPLEKFIHYSHTEYYGPKIDVCYAEGWCLNYFLRAGTKNARWKQIPEIYFKTLRDTNDAELAKKTPEHQAEQIARDAALQAAFDGVDVAELDKQFVEFAKGI
ncbi:MAG: hypothetical protein HYR85_12685 [Planctomycetes bacterium]|nr:hypothetical protein [Planctomycetota bacterium]MBI3846307.1 hypothetical protein [Planctomycetota bacterium]